MANVAVFGKMAKSWSFTSRTQRQGVDRPVLRLATAWCGMLADLSTPSCFA
jgi:hypothetical protein